ncbi:hypothetical protein NE848_10710 [Gramella jeungdoensis]|uniref:DUF2268 domain-containing protein n=1 Tax=Gramella jeungdoensis TaxID=708091 RepID=A0ABT0Z290_9FLAO|nr:DUF5700 domain-containing putative Zn-dependent protease [Gramella jeungdoensis]MCM8569853.1 hypothetical protein [Gramella jeungdoensis]
MKHQLLLSVLLLFLSHYSFSQKFNTEAVVKFWEITSILQEDREIPDSIWESYSNLPGVKKYITNNRSEENLKAHRKYLELFFKPSLSDSLAEMIGDEKLKNDDIFQNMKYLKENEEKLKLFTHEITSPTYLDSAIELTKKYLPAGNKNTSIGDLNIYIQPITYDAAVQGKDMYYGLSIVHDFDKFQIGTVAAHELHHVLRNNKEIKNSLSEKDSASVWVISKINNEGSADLIDKVLVVEHENDLFLGSLFNQILLQNIDPVMVEIDNALSLNSRKNEKFVTVKDFNKIIKYFSGHIPGFYMAEVIKRNGYEKQLIEGCENPFNIFYLYNKAAKNDPGKPFTYSQETIEYLKNLERKAYDSPSTTIN